MSTLIYNTYIFPCTNERQKLVSPAAQLKGQSRSLTMAQLIYIARPASTPDNRAPNDWDIKRLDSTTSERE